MQEVIQFLNDNKVFYLSTADGDAPRVRPFGFVMEYGGKLSFCTNNQKPVYQQMKANPKVEICASSADGKWLRVCGDVVFVEGREAKERALEVMPALGQMYAVDDGVFEIFSLDNAHAVFADMQGGGKEVDL